jgi:3-oxoacyl-(acyl-carrier-protein) synthase
MGAAGQMVVRAGLLAWKGAEKESCADSRRIGILVVGVEGSWPDWLEAKSPAEIAARWRSKPPLWLLECLPNLPAAQLAMEIGAKGPVESRRGRADDEQMIQKTLRRWQRRGVSKVLVVRSAGESAQAEVWEL